MVGFELDFSFCYESVIMDAIRAGVSHPRPDRPDFEFDLELKKLRSKSSSFWAFVAVVLNI